MRRVIEIVVSSVKYTLTCHMVLLFMAVVIHDLFLFQK